MNVPEKLTKLYYSIGEVADMFDVNSSLLRYWEKEFKELKPHKNRRGDRRFTPRDIREIQKIYYLVKTRGFTIDGAKHELATNKDIVMEETTDTNVDPLQSAEELKVKLQSIKSKLFELKNKLDA